MYDTQQEIDEFFKCLFQFRPVRKLGEGAFGLAILVLDEVEQVQKVFKLPKDKHTTEALCKEGSNLVKLSELLHPNIIRLHQFGKVRMTWNGTEEDRYYINMAYGGSSLRAKLGRLRTELDENGNSRFFGSGRRLAPEEAIRIAVDVCNGLEAAHGFRGARIRMLHRDIKPANILIDDNSGTARLSDFGLSRVIARSSSQVSGAGTYLYMDPECFHGRATVASDLYSLGIVLYEMITGELPFFDFPARFEGMPRMPSEFVPDLPPEIDGIIARALSADPKERYPDSAAMLAELRRLAARLNPLPPRFTKLSDLSAGRLLCRDEETGERVAVRLINTQVGLTELAQQCNRLQDIRARGLELPLRHFVNEQFVGVVSRVPADPDLVNHFAAHPAGSLEQLQRLCEVLAEVCDIVAVLHREGLVHGFLSPYAITVGREGPRIHDVGLSPVLRARAVSGNVHDSLELMGTLVPFMSPQTLAASQDPAPADDVYSLAAILHYLLTGEAAVGQEDRHRLMLGGAVAEVPYNVRKANVLVPPALAATIAKGLHFNPHDRPGSASEMARRIRSCRWPDETVAALIQEAVDTFPEGAGPDALLKACELLDLAVKIDPGNPRVHYARGVVYFRDGSYRHAIHELAKAALVTPEVEVLALLAEAYEHQGTDLTKAVAAYERALRHGDDPLLCERLARVLWQLGKPRRAVHMLRRAIETEPDESLRQRRRMLLQEWTGLPEPDPAEQPAEHRRDTLGEAETEDFDAAPPDNVDVNDHDRDGSA